MIPQDISTMPGFDPKVANGADSVTRGRVYFGLPASGGGIPTVCCVDHGAVLCVTRNEAGKLWRCPACNEGAFLSVEAAKGSARSLHRAEVEIEEPVGPHDLWMESDGDPDIYKDLLAQFGLTDDLTRWPDSRPEPLDRAEAFFRGRQAGAADALSIVRGLNGNGHDEPSDAALDAAATAIQRMIDERAEWPEDPEPADD